MGLFSNGKLKRCIFTCVQERVRKSNEPMHVEQIYRTGRHTLWLKRQLLYCNTERRERVLGGRERRGGDREGRRERRREERKKKENHLN